MISFDNWMNSAVCSESFPDAFDSLIDSLSLDLMEGSKEPISMKVEFVLTEARKKNNEEKPWNNEDWIESNPKLEKTDGVKEFRKNGKTVHFESYLINLLPAKQSGINMCMCATADCAATCLHTSGNVGALVDKTLARLRKSWFITLDRKEAFRQIANKILSKKKKIDEFNQKSEKEYKQLAIRLNGTSDLVWRVLKGEGGKNIFDMFPDVIFYDYSKRSDDMEAFAKGEFPNGEKFPSNYHMTLSYGGREKPYHRSTLSSGENLAVPFGPGKTAGKDYQEFPSDMNQLLKKVYFPDGISSRKQRKEYLDQITQKLMADGNFASKEELAPFAGHTLLPGLFMCHEVMDGDEYDARFLDDFLYPHKNLPNDPNRQEPEVDTDYSKRVKKKHGIVIGLTAKGDLTFSAYKGESGWDLKHTGFMVGPEDPNLSYDCDLQLNDPKKADFLKKKTDLFKKIARAVMTIRNFDARHLHGHEKGEDGQITRTHIKKSLSAEPVQTYLTAKERTTKEMNELIDVIQKVLKGEEVSVIQDKKKQQEVAVAAAKLRDYLMRPETIAILNDEEFKKEAEMFGIQVNFSNLAKLVDRHTSGPKPSLMPADTLRTLGGVNNPAPSPVAPVAPSFKEWLTEGR